jgi:hypothetical protein
VTTKILAFGNSRLLSAYFVSRSSVAPDPKSKVPGTANGDADVRQLASVEERDWFDELQQCAGVVRSFCFPSDSACIRIYMCDVFNKWFLL